jgi:hypothetical protein
MACQLAVEGINYLNVLIMLLKTSLGCEKYHIGSHTTLPKCKIANLILEQYHSKGAAFLYSIVVLDKTWT